MVRYTGINTALKEIADRWARGSRALLAESQPNGDHLAAMLRWHEHDSVALFDDPLEAVCFFVLIELAKEKEMEKEAVTQNTTSREETISGHGFW
ncbi:MAG: hypothetical protein NTZ39_04410 [Methanoregula sp.]|nr:hypothetical protein [Methanoregula sp.]